jgi:hypothetical protein
LRGIVGAFKIFDYVGLLRDDGQSIKDVRDFRRVGIDQWEENTAVRSFRMDILPSIEMEIEKQEHIIQ